MRENLSEPVILNLFQDLSVIQYINQINQTIRLILFELLRAG